MSNTQESMREAEVISYNPMGQYKWEKDTEFSLNGIEFSLVYNKLNAFLGGDFSPANVMKVMDAFIIVQNKLIEKVESGEIKEKEAEEKM